jgi:hypothetical protein
MTPTLDRCRELGLPEARPTNAPGTEAGTVVRVAYGSPRLHALQDDFRLVPSGPTHTLVLPPRSTRGRTVPRP